MKIDKKPIVLLLFIIFNYNCTQMDTTTCFNIDTFSTLTALIKEEGKVIMLHERLVADKNESAKEISFEHYFIEFISDEETSQIIVIDTEREIPTYFCEVKDDVFVKRFKSNVNEQKVATKTIQKKEGQLFLMT